MSTYGTKKALVDLGFVDGYFYSRSPNIEDEGFHDNLMEAFDRIEKTVVEGTLLTASPAEAEYRKLLRDLGFVRGWAWQKKIPDAISDAITRVIDYFSESLPVSEIVFVRPKELEPREKMVSDDERHEIKDWYGKWPHVEGISFASGMDDDVVARIVEPVRDREAEARIEAEFANEFEIEPVVSEENHIAEADEVAEIEEVSEIASRTSPSGRDAYNWQGWQKAKLREMKLAGTFSWKQIAEVIGKTPGQCSSTWHWEKQKLEQAGGAILSRTSPAGAGTSEDNLKVGVRLGDVADLPQEVIEQLSQRNRQHQATDNNQGMGTEAETTTSSPTISLARPEPLAEPEALHRLTVAHSGYAGKRDPDQELTEADWPDIQNMLEKMRRSVSQIASDYDVEFATMRQFIDRHLWKGKSAPGEAHASSR